MLVRDGDRLLHVLTVAPLASRSVIVIVAAFALSPRSCHDTARLSCDATVATDCVDVVTLNVAND